MLYDTALIVAVTIFLICLIHRVDRWFLSNVGMNERGVTAGQRVSAAGKETLAVIFSPRIFAAIGVFIRDVLFQWKILKDRNDPLAWVMHLLLFWGFVPLLLFHALAATFTVALDSGYESTLNPYLWLRDLFGVITLAGLALAVYRRFVQQKDTMKTTARDIVPLVLLASLIASGFLLQGIKIPSHDAFQGMVDDYSDGLEGEEAQALEAYWVAEFGLAPGAAAPPVDPAVIARGRELHEAQCMSCHSQPQGAAVSYAVSRLIKPVSASLDQMGANTFFWYLHVLIALAGLALFMFGKLAHVITTPVSLLVAGLRSGEAAAPELKATRQVIEKDGCSHGGWCHPECPVREARLERIGERGLFQPSLDYTGQKSSTALGSRPVND